MVTLSDIFISKRTIRLNKCMHQKCNYLMLTNHFGVHWTKLWNKWNMYQLNGTNNECKESNNGAWQRHLRKNATYWFSKRNNIYRQVISVVFVSQKMSIFDAVQKINTQWNGCMFTQYFLPAQSNGNTHNQKCNEQIHVVIKILLVWWFKKKLQLTILVYSFVNFDCLG